MVIFEIFKPTDYFKMFRNLTRKIGDTRRFISQNRNFKEVVIQVPWGYVSGKWWEPYDVRPVLAVHGWQDNCGSFNRLIPLLTRDVGFLAIDLPGHGYSSRLPPGIEYSSNIYLLTLMSIQSKLNWPKVSLMGHSLGAIASYMYALFFNDMVDFTVHIDVFKPLVRNVEVRHKAANLQNFFKYNAYFENSEEPPSYTWEELKVKVCTPHSNSVAMEHCHHLLERNIAPSKIHPGKFYFTRDPRLKMTNPIMFTQEQTVADAQLMKKPLFVVKFTNASYYEKKEHFYETLEVVKKASVDCEAHFVEEKHHGHLNRPELISDLINSFICKNEGKDRSIGGLEDGLIVDQNVRSFS